ncbi:MAG: elongation factor P [Candidatus Atribacteria bacterium]|nr:elongation factor P [Candidatus Atribacteria bacterium]
MADIISNTDLRVGTCIDVDGTLYVVTAFQPAKFGKWSWVTKTKLRDINTGFIVEKVFKPGDKIVRAILEGRQAQYMYKDDGGFHFLDQETFEDVLLSSDLVGEASDFLIENMMVEILMYGDKYVSINLPSYVELKVVDAPPGIKGDTASGGSKPATLETGIVVQVPLFVNIGEIIRVDTRTREYLERA